MAKALLAMLAIIFALKAEAQQKSFALVADPALVESGLLKYILPRFSLKTGVKVALTASDGDATLGVEAGTPAFQSGAEVYRIALNADAADGHAARFRDWLLSDVGLRAVLAFRADGAALYVKVEDAPEEVVEEELAGDPAIGETLALRHCGRCHVVNDKNRFGGIGSTPSFGAMKNLPRWRERFDAFWTLNPHPSFTQIEEVTDPFDPTRPPPIAPLELTLDDVDAIIAYVVRMPTKDLGGALVTQ